MTDGNKDERRTSKFMQYALAASELAFSDAGWRPTTAEEQWRTVRPDIALPIAPHSCLINPPTGDNTRFRHWLPRHPPLHLTRLFRPRPQIRLAILCPQTPDKPCRGQYFHQIRSQRALPRAKYGMHHRITQHNRRRAANRYRSRGCHARR